MAYFAMLPIDDTRWLDPEYQGGRDDLTLDVRVPKGHLVRGMTLEGCVSYHIRVPPELLGSIPTRVVVTPGNDGYLPDFGIGPWGGWKLVSQAFVNIVERFEPGVHEFLPITETVDQQGRLVEKRFFLMNILQSINAVYVERSSVSFHERHIAEINFTVRTMLLAPPSILVLKRALVEGHHLWHGTTEDIYQVFFSEELRSAVLAAGLSSLEYFHAEEL